MAKVALCSPSANFSSSSPPRPPPSGPDPAVFREFYRKHAGFVRRVLSGRGVWDSAVEDIAQEVFLVAFKKWETLILDDVRRWLYVVALQLATNYRNLARHRREKLCDELPERSMEGYDPEAMDVPKFFERALKRLRPKVREVFVRYALQEEPMESIVADLRINVKTAYARVELAKANIARMVR